MDLSFGSEYDTFRDEVKTFITSNRGAAPTANSDAEVGLQWQKKLIEAGYTARTIPKIYVVATTARCPRDVLRAKNIGDIVDPDIAVSETGDRVAPGTGGCFAVKEKQAALDHMIVPVLQFVPVNIHFV